jgi:hypothetical protein
MTNDFCFLSVAFGERYIEQQRRLNESLERIHPDAEHVMWTNNYPPGSRSHKDSLYGFKPHAVKALLDAGYKKIIWLDTACILQQTVDYWLNLNLPVVAAKDDNALSKCIADKALNYYGNPDITGMHLVGGSVYVFNFYHPDCQKIFDHWAKAEADGIFGSQVEQSSGKINRHRHDESCLAMALYQNGYEPVPCDVMRYNQGEDSIVIKKHFK